MPKKIFKYKLENLRVQTIEMPRSAEILFVETQNNTPFILALIDENKHEVYRTFEILGR